MVVENLAFHNGPEQYLSLEICPVAFPWHFYVTKPTEWGNANFFIRINSSWLFILCIVTTTFTFTFTFHFFNEINKKLWFYTLKLLLGNFFFPISTMFHSCTVLNSIHKLNGWSEGKKGSRSGFEKLPQNCLFIQKCANCWDLEFSRNLTKAQGFIVFQHFYFWLWQLLEFTEKHTRIGGIKGKKIEPSKFFQTKQRQQKN